jgi:hypothetical protein
MGRGTQKDDVKATNWFRYAARQGYAPAQYNLGRLYETGIGVKEDKTIAIELYQIAAKQGNEEAQLRLKKLNSTQNKAPSAPTPKNYSKGAR